VKGGDAKGGQPSGEEQAGGSVRISDDRYLTDYRGDKRVKSKKFGGEKDMKKLFVILLALGLMMAFSMPAAATDMKISGSYYVQGFYDDNHNLVGSSWEGSSASSAWYGQRLRVNGNFQVADGLKLVTRFDAMEKVWGQDVFPNSGATRESVDLSWERAYVQFATQYGNVYVGYMSGGAWGTVFNDSEGSVPRIKFVTSMDKWIFLALTEKGVEGDFGTAVTDADYDKYAVAAIYKFDWGQVGLLEFYLPARNYTEGGLPSGPANVWNNYLSPYFKGTFGDLYLEGEASIFFGEIEYDSPSATNVDRKGYSAYLYAKYNLGGAYIGGQFGWVSGDDEDTKDKNEAGFPNNDDWDPCLILWNYNLHKWMGNMGNLPWNGGGTGSQMQNAMLFQAFAGTTMDKLTVRGSLTYAKADEKPNDFIDDDYGIEFDIEAIYKIYDNLTYEVGFGYLWTGDYYKGDYSNADIDDNYLVVNKLTLKF